MLTLLGMLASCESTQDLEIGLRWEDDQYLESSQKIYLSILKGVFDSNSGFDSQDLATVEVICCENQTYSFSFSSSGSSSYTAFVYIDKDGNAKYEEGYDLVCGYKYNYGNTGEPTFISLSVCY